MTLLRREGVPTDANAGALRRGAIALVPLVIVVLLVATTFVASTRTGIGVATDSTVYLDGARSIADGRGYTSSTATSAKNAIEHYPPLYSTALAGADVVGIGVKSGARLVNGVLIAATVALLYLLVLRSTRGSQVAAVLASVAFGLSLTIVQLTGRALSEAPYLFIVVAWALAVHQFARNGGAGNRVLLVAVTAVGPLTRYAGFALLAALPIVVLLVERVPRRARIRDAIVLTLLAALPAALWTLRNALADGSDSQRLATHIISRSKVAEGVDTVANWLFPTPIPEGARRWLLLALILGLGFVAALHARRLAPWIRQVAAQAPGALALTVFGLAHVAVLAFTVSFADASVRFNGRQLAPLLLVLVVDVAVLATFSSWSVRVVTAALACVLITMYAFETGDAVANGSAKEGGLTASFFSRSELLHVAKGAGDGVRINTNGPDILLANTELTNVRGIPPRYRRSIMAPNAAFDAEVRRIGERVLAGRTMVILWYYPPRPHVMNAEDLLQRVPELHVDHYPEGVVFTKP